MKILIVSDTHGAHGYLNDAMEQVGEINMFIHLGDIADGLNYLDSKVSCEKHFIAGNGDYFLPLPKESEFMIDSKKAFITHGHKYIHGWGTKNIDALVLEGRKKNADIVMFGHTHSPLVERLHDITVLNPGSISYPRQFDKKNSFILMEVDESKQLKYTIYYREESGEFRC